MGIMPTRGRGSNKHSLTREQILAAQQLTVSGSAAARYLHVNYATYKKHAERLGILDQHKNKRGAGVSKRKYEGQFGLEAILANQYPQYDRTKLKRRIIEAALLKEECAICRYAEHRLMDGQVPLVLHTIENHDDLRLKNLRLLCFNCSFLTANTLSKKLLDGRGDYKFNHSVHSADILTTTTPDALVDMMHEIRDELAADST